MPGPTHLLLSTGTQDVFERGQRNYRISGTWGYSGVTVDTGLNTSAVVSTAATSVTLDGTVDGVIEVGHTVLLGTEQMYVTNVATGGTSINVQRAVNGPATGSHGAAASVSIYVYPEPIREAAIGQVSRLFKRGQAGWVSEIGLPETGVVQVMSPRGRLDPDVKALVGPFRRLR
jgi:hypothetical protein